MVRKVLSALSIQLLSLQQWAARARGVTSPSGELLGSLWLLSLNSQRWVTGLCTWRLSYTYHRHKCTGMGLPANLLLLVCAFSKRRGFIILTTPPSAGHIIGDLGNIPKVPKEHWDGGREALSEGESSSSWNRAMKRLVGIKGSSPATGPARAAGDAGMNKQTGLPSYSRSPEAPNGHLDHLRNKTHRGGKRCYQLRAVPLKLFLPQVFLTVSSVPENRQARMGLSPSLAHQKHLVAHASFTCEPTQQLPPSEAHSNSPLWWVLYFLWLQNTSLGLFSIAHSDLFMIDHCPAFQLHCLCFLMCAVSLFKENTRSFFSPIGCLPKATSLKVTGNPSYIYLI